MLEIFVGITFSICLWALFCNHVTYQKVMKFIDSGFYRKYQGFNRLYDPVFTHLTLFKLNKNPLNRIQMTDEDRKEAEKL